MELLHLVVALEDGLDRLNEAVAAVGDEDNGDLLPVVVVEGSCLSAYHFSW